MSANIHEKIILYNQFLGSGSPRFPLWGGLPRLFRCRGLALFNGPVPCYNRKKRNRVIFLEFYGTIGPACAQLETLQRMVEAGMTGIRMNLSRRPLSAHKDWLDIIHAVGIPQLLIDLQGPELPHRHAAPAPLCWNQARTSGWARRCPARQRWCMQPGRVETLLLDDGRLCAGGRSRGAALQCTVLRRHPASRKSLAAPGLTIGLPHVDGGPHKPAAGRPAALPG